MWALGMTNKIPSVLWVVMHNDNRLPIVLTDVVAFWVSFGKWHYSWCHENVITISSKWYWSFTTLSRGYQSIVSVVSYFTCHSQHYHYVASKQDTPQRTRIEYTNRGHSGYGLSQWETLSQCNVFFHWLSTYPEWVYGCYTSCSISCVRVNLLNNYLMISWNKMLRVCCCYDVHPLHYPACISS